MASVENILAKMCSNPRGIRYDELIKVCDNHFGPSRSSATSHAVYKTPWQGDPRVNIQNDKGKAKAHQVKQVLRAIDKLREENR